MSSNNPYDSPPGMPPKQQPPGGRQGASALDAIIPTNPLAAVSCWTGIIGLILCPCGPVLGPIAIITGILALKKWKLQESSFGHATSTIRAWIGIVTGTLGLIVGTLMIILNIIAAASR